ncbi:oligosaccharide flippase family protein [Streptococcus sp. E29BA]|uniref:putative polysaccharide biosynthesis protein n=1 Tax=Streptococcus sp. E29BA TaxID=3278716 RepID=UPI00359D6CB4
MLRGTAWLTFANIAGRLLGAVYIIPWYAWMGKVAAPQANALYGMGYTLYATFLVLSTTGINTAISKQIAKYNAIDQEAKGIGLAKQFIGIMFLSGLIFASILYLGAPVLSRLSGAEQTLVPVLRSLTLAVLVFPMMSVCRGIFQGYHHVKPNALSQLAEQLIRVIWMLLTTFYIMKMGSKDYVSAVTQSTFAAFVGMLASFAVLGYYFWQSGLLSKFLKASPIKVQYQESLQLIKETFRTAIPMILTGVAIQLYQLIDQATFVNVLSFLTEDSKERLTVIYAYLSANPNKIVMLIVAVAITIGDVGIPLLTESHIKGDKRGVARLMLNGFQMLTVFALPALMGAILLAEPLYVVFYNPSENLAIGLFIATLAQTFLQCAYFALSPVLHAVNESRAAVRYFYYGVVVKLLTQLPLLFLFQAYGPVLSTALALLVPSILFYRHLRAVTQFNPNILVRDTALIARNTLLMCVPVFVIYWGLSLVIQPSSRLLATVHLVVGASVGMMVYGYLSLKTRSLDKLLGQRAQRLRDICRIR